MPEGEPSGTRRPEMVDLTPLVRIYARFRLKRIDSLPPGAVQEKELRGLLSAASQTRFGREHGLSAVRTVEDFQRAVPLRYYEDFWEEYWKEPFPVLEDCTWPGRVPYFALSSGTSSGTTKNIPLTEEMIRSNRIGAADLLVYHLAHQPESRLVGGKIFMLSGSTNLREPAPGVKAGDLSGIALATAPLAGRPWTFPPERLARIENWEEKIARIAEEAVRTDLRVIGGIPSWMRIFFEKAAELVGDDDVRLARLWPELEMVVHGGVNFDPYYDAFTEYLEGSHAELREDYPASEGYIANADRGYGEGLRMTLDHGIFFEFVPVEELESDRPTRHWIGNVETGVNYAIVVSTCAGLWGFVIGDTVRFVDVNPPRILVTGRISYMMSAFGEHLIAEEVEDAVSTAAGAIGRTVSDYSMGARFPEEAGDPGNHRFVVEFHEGMPPDRDLDRFAEIVDRRLSERNEDYAAHRAEGFGLAAPEVVAVQPGTFRAWMKKRGKLGGQHKVPRIINDQDLLADLLAFVGW
jgi:hypothetical protein